MHRDVGRYKMTHLHLQPVTERDTLCFDLCSCMSHVNRAYLKISSKARGIRTPEKLPFTPELGILLFFFFTFFTFVVDMHFRYVRHVKAHRVRCGTILVQPPPRVLLGQ